MDQFVKLQPQLAKGHYWKGMNLYKLSSYTAAAKCMVDCLDKNPTYPSAHYISGQCHSKSGE